MCSTRCNMKVCAISQPIPLQWQINHAFTERYVRTHRNPPLEYHLLRNGTVLFRLGLVMDAWTWASQPGDGFGCFRQKPDFARGCIYLPKSLRPLSSDNRSRIEDFYVLRSQLDSSSMRVEREGAPNCHFILYCKSSLCH